MHQTDYLIVGAGILGLTIARELVAEGVDNIIILEKEPHLGVHSSGRNSGVLHAGIYYKADTLKAKFCLQGNQMMQQYCQENELPLDNCGKVIVARCETELPTLLELQQRAEANGAKVSLIDTQELASIEPNAFTVEKALYSHLTAVVDPKLIIKRMQQELEASGKVTFLFDTRYLTQSQGKAKTSRGDIQFNKLINVAGAYADTVAKTFGLAKNLSLLPFKGIYRKVIAANKAMVRGNIYPVPDIRNPFLGVHFTRSIAGDVYVGPTAMPALGRESYSLFSKIDRESLINMLRSSQLFIANSAFRRVALSEPKKYCKHNFYRDAKRLVKQFDKSSLGPIAKVGIRPQLVDWETKQLVMDFKILQSDNALHVLNAISPAFTSSMAFAKYLVSRLDPVIPAN